jgi:hypothetical protein
MSSRYGNTAKKLQEQRKRYQDEWSKYYWNEFVLKNPDKHWDWGWLSRNPNITWEIVEANPDKPWDWNGLSINPNFSWDIVNANPDKPWNWNGLSSNQFKKSKEIFMEKKMREHIAAFKIQNLLEKSKLRHSIV